MPVAARLPGIQFDVVAPAAPLALVRMDIAVFVGFAASGPLNTPVPVESITRFEEIFRDDLLIASDPATRLPVYALLPSSVRAFFRNGGSRCWIVRVAATSATANRFPIPGLMVLGGGAPTQAFALARSEGSWSDGIAVGAAVRSQSLDMISFDPDRNALRLLLSGAGDLSEGDLLRLSFGSPDEALWMFVDRVVPVVLSPPLSVLSRSFAVDIVSTRMYWNPGSIPGNLDSPACERLTMDLFVQSNSDLYTLTQLGFAPSHPRYWAHLPSDTELFSTDTLDELWADAAYPRFPLAGEDRKGYYIPVGIGALPTSFKGPEMSNAPDPVVRDGVSVFAPGLFLDPALADSSSADLLNEAYFIQFQSYAPRKLTGIHAAIDIDEATIIAVPDAVQRGWFQAVISPLAPPVASLPLPHPEWWHSLDCNRQQPFPLVLTRPVDRFEACELLVVEAPQLTIASQTGTMYTLAWSAPQQFAEFTDFLEEALDPGFTQANVIYQGQSQNRTIYGRPPGDYYYRVRREVGAITSNYSNGIAIRVQAESDLQINPATHYSNAALLTIQSALVRMCSARGDMQAVLGMPQHYREDEAIAHATALASSFSANSRDASFAALYHPWLIGREENDLLNLRATPPDGAMAGVMAARSSQRGPWISPANQALSGVVDMTPIIPRIARQSLQDASVNLVRQEPAGFLCLCELTLSNDPDLANINVRRLLSFLRKTALREGALYVFEPNNDVFRRSVERGFEDLLIRLFAMGAFAGGNSRDAFQVVADSSLNTPQTVDKGQFIVELRVAPSMPMRFLTIRLIQNADRTFVTEGGA